MKLWLDDVRPAPEGWLWAKTYEEAVTLFTHYDITEMSLDHDLGLKVIESSTSDSIIAIAHEDKEAKTGYDFACWIERGVHMGEHGVPVMRCHSANPVGRKRIEQVESKL